MTTRLSETMRWAWPRATWRRRDVVVASASIGVVAAMLGLTYAAVPLYRLFCQATGFAGTTQVATSAPGAVGTASVTVRFDSNVASNLPWRFEPPGAVEVRLGEERQVTFTATNVGDQPFLGTATFNVTPLQIGKYFDKIECFCFTEQLLMPGERKEFPVTFFVDPAIAADDEGKDVTAITLSYTFYNKGSAALDEYLRTHQMTTGSADGAKR